MRLNHETALAAVSSMPSLNWLKFLLMFAQWKRDGPITCHDGGSSVNTITVWGVTSQDITRVDNDITPVMTPGAQ